MIGREDGRCRGTETGRRAVNVDNNSRGGAPDAECNLDALRGQEGDGAGGGDLQAGGWFEDRGRSRKASYADLTFG